MKRFNFFLANTLIFAVMLLIGSAIAATISYRLDGTNGRVESGNTELNDPAWKNVRESCLAYLSVDLLDDDGNVAILVYLDIRRSYYGKLVRAKGNVIEHAVRYSGYAGVSASNHWEGLGNAWVQMPGKDRAHDEDPFGAVDIGGDGEPSSVYASDSCLRDGFALNRNAEVSAGCWHGGVSAQVGIQISDF